MLVRFIMALICLAGCGLPTVVGHSNPTRSQPLMWVVAGPQPSYLFGTVHLGEPRILALPSEVKNALNLATRLYVEGRESVIRSPVIQRFTQDESGRPLARRLPPDLYQRVQRHFQRYGVSLSTLHSTKLWMVYMMAGVVMYQRYQGTVSLDNYLERLAIKAGKKVIGLENPRTFFAALDAIAPRDWLVLLEASMVQFDKLRAGGRDLAKQLVEAYLRGDVRALMRMFNWVGQSKQARRFMKILLTDRNRAMTQRMAQHLKAEPSERHFFAVGVAHLIGRDGVVAQLRARGFKVTRVQSHRGTATRH